MPSTLVKKCSCDARATCIHTVTLSSSGFSKIYQYTQWRFEKDIYAVDKGGKGFDVSVNIIKKPNAQNACLPRCGSGVIFNDYGDGSYQPLNAGENSWTLKYRGKEEIPSAVKFINAIVLADKYAIPPSDYRLQVFECAGRFENEKLFFSQLGVVYSGPSGGLNVIDTMIHVYPEASFSVNLTLSYTGSTSTYTDEERKQARAEQNTNRKASKQKDLRNAHKGWTKYTPEFKQENELKVEGEAQYTFGNKTEKYKEELFSKKTKKDKYTLNVIDKSFDTIGKFSSMLSSGKGKFNLIETKIKPPCIKLNGSGTFNPKHEQYNIDKKLKVELSPLIGMSVTLDLIQALASFYKMNAVVDRGREQLSCLDRESNCADIKCNLVVESNINTTFDIKTDNNKKDIEFAGETKGEVIFKLDSNLSVKYNVWVVVGVFEIGGNILTKGFSEFQKVENDIELVFYHDGITADVTMKYAYSVRENKNTNNNYFSHPEKQVSKKWVLFDKLPKDKSIYKVRF
ncbi:hypothetical protein [Photobacterium damselae]|uniref:hypothetical protein n=1 Tax=Photobacterium damselae TaxID=38293 RepID=UPI0030F3B230